MEIESKEVMRILNISRATFSLWIRDKKITPIKRIGRRWIFDKEYIENYGRIGTDEDNRDK